MEFRDIVSPFLEKTLGRKITVEKFKPVGGGCISHGGCLHTSAGEFFMKWNNSAQYPGMFKAEAIGLRTLVVTDGLRIPRVVGVLEANAKQFIILEWISTASRERTYWSKLGQGLAAIHKNAHNRFGLDHNNYIGSLPQSNTWHASWNDFFVQERLSPQLRMLQDTGGLTESALRQFGKLFGRLDHYFPREPPCLIHGDLWSGNLMTDEKGAPCLIDPAIYYGSREAELAFTTLFGGFDREFYNAYEEAFPLESGFEERLDLYNLYPLLVHANLFGGGYLHQAMSIVQRYL